MNENDFKEILAEICDEEIFELNKFPPFKPSLRHRLAMKRIFAAFERNIRKAKAVPEPILTAQNTHKRLSTRLMILFAVIVCAALLTGAVIVYYSKSFYGTVFPDYTRLFAFDTENCLTTIKYKYYLSELPEGFEQTEHSSTRTSVYTRYVNESGQGISFDQYTKDSFSPHYNTEYHNFEEIEINGHNGLCLDFSDNEHDHSLIVWDNGDYILEITGDISKNDMIILAKSAEISKN